MMISWWQDGELTEKEKRKNDTQKILQPSKSYKKTDSVYLMFRRAAHAGTASCALHSLD